MNRNLIIFLTVIGIVALTATAAFAQGPGRRGGDGDRGRGAPPVFGVITGISADSITVEPQIPQEMLERVAENGRELPGLPDSITVDIDDSTLFYFDSAEATAGAFSVGDEVVIMTRQGTGDTPLACKVADSATAREFLKNRMGNRGGGQGNRGGGEGRGMRGGGGQGMEPGQGQGRGMRGDQGGPGQGGKRGGPPIFGEITAMDDAGATIKIELPDFILERMAENGRELPEDMPSEVTVTFGERCRFARNSEMVEDNPFGVGDKVAVMARKGDGNSPVAFLMADWASAEARIGQGMGGEGRGMRDGSGPGCNPDSQDDDRPRRNPGRRSR